MYTITTEGGERGGGEGREECNNKADDDYIIKLLTARHKYCVLTKSKPSSNICIFVKYFTQPERVKQETATSQTRQ